MPDGKKLTLPLRTLLDTAETLNNASNSLNTSLQAVEDQLNAANIGLEVWLEAPAQRLERIRDRWEMDERDRRTFTELGLTSLVDGRDCYICTELGYARTGDGWHLAVREWSDREHLLALTRRVQLFEQLLGRLAGSYQDIRVLRRAVLCDWLTVPLLRNQEETAHLQRMLQGTLQHYGDILQEARCEWDESRHCYRMVFVTRGSTTTFTTVVDDALLISNEIRNLRTLARQFEELGTSPYILRSGEVEHVASDFPELLQAVNTAGTKDLNIQRYKGLGEMNPSQLWDTTMDPTRRTLLQVTIEDAVEADYIFTTLMGDQVDPRKAFIEQHAKEVAHLDV